MEVEYFWNSMFEGVRELQFLCDRVGLILCQIGVTSFMNGPNLTGTRSERQNKSTKMLKTRAPVC